MIRRTLRNYKSITALFGTTQVDYGCKDFNKFEFQIFNTKMDVNPDLYDLENSDNVYSLSVLFSTRQKDYPRCLRMCKQLIKLKHRNGYISMGHFFRLNGQIEEAKFCYKKGYEQSNSCSALWNLALLFFEEGIAPEENSVSLRNALICYTEYFNIEHDSEMIATAMLNMILIHFILGDNMPAILFLFRKGFETGNQDWMNLLIQLVCIIISDEKEAYIIMYKFLMSLKFTNHMIERGIEFFERELNEEDLLKTKMSILKISDIYGKTYYLDKDYPFVMESEIKVSQIPTKKLDM